MASSLARRLQGRLQESEVLVEPERRGHDPQPGRPDSMLWLRPEALPVGRLVPLLVELEGAKDTTAAFHASKTDVREFARRHDPQARSSTDENRYHLACPTLDGAVHETLRGSELRPDPFGTPAPFTPVVEYELFVVSSTTVTGEREATDASLHQALRHRYGPARRNRRSPSGFRTDASIHRRGRTEVVTWDVHWSLPNATEGTLSIPFLVESGDRVEQVLEKVYAQMTIPMMVVITDSPAAHTATKTHETGVQFQSVTENSLEAGKTGTGVSHR